MLSKTNLPFPINPTHLTIFSSYGYPFSIPGSFPSICDIVFALDQSDLKEQGLKRKVKSQTLNSKPWA